MKPAIVSVILLLTAVPVLPAAAAGLDAPLEFLAPLLDRDWEGGYVEERAVADEIRLRFEPILDGKAVRYSRVAERHGFSAVTHFYYVPDSGEVRFLTLNSRGIAEEGVVVQENGAIVLRGTSHWPDQTVEFETTWELIGDDTLRDTFTRKTHQAGSRGHVQEFHAKEAP